MNYQVTEYYMNGEAGEIAGIFETLEAARGYAQKCIRDARKTQKECRESYIEICPLLEDGSLGDPVESFQYEPVRD